MIIKLTFELTGSAIGEERQMEFPRITGKASSTTSGVTFSPIFYAGQADFRETRPIPQQL